MQRKRRGQLLLARSQEQSGEAAEALENYRALLECEDRQQVEARLGLMRLQQAEPALCRQHAQAALSLADRLQPLLYAVTSLEAGLYLAQSGAREDAAASFKRAAQLAEQLGQPLLQARAHLALAASNPSARSDLGPALQRLLDPADRYELMDSAWWMVPLLLRRQAQFPHPLQERLLRTLGRDVPGVFLRLAQAGRLEGPTRRSLVLALTDNSHPTAQNCLRLLAGDSEASVRQAAEQVLQAGTGKLVPPTLRIYTLGSFEVWRGEERVADSAFRSWKQRFLLARLAGTSRPLAAERLIDEFWPDDADGGRASLNVGVSHMRKLLRPSHWPEDLDYVPRNASGLSLNRELPIWHDFEEFEKAAEGDSLVAWQQAVELYRGPYLDNCYQDWAVAQRSRAENLVLAALTKLLVKLQGSQRPQEVLLYGNRLLEWDSCSQEAHLAVMQAQLELGRPEAALRQFDVCKRVLEREMGLEPSIAMLEMRQRVLLCT